MKVFSAIAALIGLCLCASPAPAWVALPGQPPTGDFTVITDPFCRSDGCYDSSLLEEFSLEEWQAGIRNAVQQWNAVNAGVHIHTRAALPGEDPCNLPLDVLPIMIVDGGADGRVCPGDHPVPGFGGRYSYSSRVYISRKLPAGVSTLSRLITHEIGHRLGLDHPDENGQSVPSIMNSDLHCKKTKNDATTTIRWCDTPQPDDIAGLHALYGGQPQESLLVGVLENPPDGASRSGIGVISGWVCEAEQVEIVFNSGTAQEVTTYASYGTAREDTRGRCDDSNNGFGLLFNWNLLGDGQHTVVARVDGQELGRATVKVTTLDGEFPKGLSGQFSLEFPDIGDRIHIRWDESVQNFVIIRKD